MSFSVGDQVVKNPATWTPKPDFDAWGRGAGVGVVVEPPFGLDEGDADVRWPAGRCFERADGLLPARSFCACTPVCEEDARWVDQYLAEVERLGCQFAVHFDRCSEATKGRMSGHPLFVGATHQDDPCVEHRESAREGPHGVAVAAGFLAAVLWDIDELWGEGTRARWDGWLAGGADCGLVRWLNLWGDAAHVRTDNPGCPVRVKLVRLSVPWQWRGPIVMGPYRADREEPSAEDTGSVCYNCGLMTRELRLQHKERWDRVYGAYGGNPYGYWDWLLDEDAHPPVVEEL